MLTAMYVLSRPLPALLTDARGFAPDLKVVIGVTLVHSHRVERSVYRQHRHSAVC